MLSDARQLAAEAEKWAALCRGRLNHDTARVFDRLAVALRAEVDAREGLTESLRLRIGERDAAVAAAGQAKEALAQLANRTDGDGLPCWCENWTESRPGFADSHWPYCLAARAVLVVGDQEETK